MNDQRDLLALPGGSQIGNYVIVRKIGGGGFGITYLARQISGSSLYAIKELFPVMMVTRNRGRVETHSTGASQDWNWAQERFQQEAEVLATCEHPNVVKVFSTFAANGTMYMVTKYEDGETLTAWLASIWHARRRASEGELLNVLRPVLSALSYIHAKSVLHRDIKPDNIYLTRDFRPILLDFGSARYFISGRSNKLTQIVSDGYAPIDQYGMRTEGPWTDLYALGAVMYYALRGEKPPAATERFGGQVTCPYVQELFRNAYSAPFLACIDWALAIETNARPQRAEDWSNNLRSSHTTDYSDYSTRPVDGAGYSQPSQNRPASVQWQGPVSTPVRHEPIADGRRNSIFAGQPNRNGEQREGHTRRPRGADSTTKSLAFLFPGLGLLPQAPLLSAVLYLVATGGAYLLALISFSAGFREIGFSSCAVGLALHIRSALRATGEGDWKAFHILPASPANWLSSGAFILVIIAEMLVIIYVCGPANVFASRHNDSIIRVKCV